MSETSTNAKVDYAAAVAAIRYAAEIGVASSSVLAFLDANTFGDAFAVGYLVTAADQSLAADQS